MSKFLVDLLEINLAAGAAIAFMLLVRKPAQRLIGPRAVYLLWAIVPTAMLATFIPARTIEVTDPSLPERVIVTAYIPMTGIDWAGIGVGALGLLWSAGAVALAGGLVWRQAMFQSDVNRGTAGPAVVGFHHPRIVTPDDFAERFSYDERRLILTHEEVHVDHGDSRINAVIALVRCVCWFNPLVHLGAKFMRLDQELACDAEVITRRPKGRRAYAETLLKTELASRSVPIGCYWPPEAQHPLKERIAMLARSPLSRRRHLIASAAVMMLTASGGVAAWAAQPERPIFKEPMIVYVMFQPLTGKILPVEGAAMKTDTEPAPAH